MVYIDGKPYFLDNTWIDKENKLFNNENFLVSTDTFMKTHGEYVEVKKYECPENYSRYDIIEKTKNCVFGFWETICWHNVVNIPALYFRKE